MYEKTLEFLKFKDIFKMLIFIISGICIYCTIQILATTSTHTITNQDFMRIIQCYFLLISFPLAFMTLKSQKKISGDTFIPIILIAFACLLEVHFSLKDSYAFWQILLCITWLTITGILAIIKSKEFQNTRTANRKNQLSIFSILKRTNIKNNKLFISKSHNGNDKHTGNHNSKHRHINTNTLHSYSSNIKTQEIEIEENNALSKSSQTHSRAIEQPAICSNTSDCTEPKTEQASPTERSLNEILKDQGFTAETISSLENILDKINSSKNKEKIKSELLKLQQNEIAEINQMEELQILSKISQKEEVFRRDVIYMLKNIYKKENTSSLKYYFRKIREALYPRGKSPSKHSPMIFLNAAAKQNKKLCSLVNAFMSAGI